MNYGIDFKIIGVKEFYKYIKTRDLMKSHLILKEDIEYYSEFFIGNGLETLEELYDVIKTKSRVIKYAKQSGLDEEYLIILRRHIMSFIVKPRKINDFKMIDPVDKYILDAENIEDTKTLFFSPEIINRCPNKDYIQSILELTTLRYVSASFAEAIHFAGYKTIKDISKAVPEEFRDRINEASKQYSLFKSVFGLSDSQYLIDDANLFIRWQKNNT